MQLKQIAHIEGPYETKFGVPRQAGLAECRARVVFEPEYRVAEALRGLEGFDYVWLLWGFHLNGRQEWSPTVRPPRLGGNKRVGVFATRSPYRPNAVGLSSVRLMEVTVDAQKGPVLVVEGADLVSGTPIYDIKPYLAYADSHPEALGGRPAKPAGKPARRFGGGLAPVAVVGPAAALPGGPRTALCDALRWI